MRKVIEEKIGTPPDSEAEKNGEDDGSMESVIIRYKSPARKQDRDAFEFGDSNV